MDLAGNEPFLLFLGVVAVMAAFALTGRMRRRPRRGAVRWGRDGADRRDEPNRAGATGHWQNDSSRGPGATDGGASDAGA